MIAFVLLVAVFGIALYLFIEIRSRDRKEQDEYKAWQKSIQSSMDRHNKEMDEIFKNIDQLIEKSKNEKK